jgi:hypothetical protein
MLDCSIHSNLFLKFIYVNKARLFDYLNRTENFKISVHCLKTEKIKGTELGSTAFILHLVQYVDGIFS